MEVNDKIGGIEFNKGGDPNEMSNNEGHSRIEVIRRILGQVQLENFIVSEFS